MEKHDETEQCPAVLRLRKLKGQSGTNLASLSKARLKELIEQAIVDAYTEEEQAGGFSP